MNPDLMLKLFTEVLVLCWIMQPFLRRMQPRPAWRPDREVDARRRRRRNRRP